MVFDLQSKTCPIVSGRHLPVILRKPEWQTQVEVLAAVFTVRPDTAGRQRLHVLLWQRALEPDAGRWALPGGLVLQDEDVDASAARQLAEKVDLTRVTHLEQIGVFSDPDRMPEARVVATGFLGLVPLDADPQLPEDTAWHPVDDLPPTALDHGLIADRAHRRLQAKLSYTNIGFALAPADFTIGELRRVYATALGHDVDPDQPAADPDPARDARADRVDRGAPARAADGRPRCTGSPSGSCG